MTIWLKGEQKKGGEILVDLLQRRDLKSAYRVLMLNNIAWSDLILDDPTLLEEADKNSLLAWERASHPSFNGTPGLVLVKLGRLNEGIRLLRYALRHNTALADRAANACSLAIAEAARGDQTTAHEYLALARDLDPANPLLPQAVRAMDVRSA